MEGSDQLPRASRKHHGHAHRSRGKRRPDSALSYSCNILYRPSIHPPPCCLYGFDATTPSPYGLTGRDPEVRVPDTEIARFDRLPYFV